MRHEADEDAADLTTEHEGWVIEEDTDALAEISGHNCYLPVAARNLESLRDALTAHLRRRKMADDLARGTAMDDAARDVR